MEEPKVGTRTFTSTIINTYYAWKRVWGEAYKDVVDEEATIPMLLYFIVMCIKHRLRCLFTWHGETHILMSLKDPGWAAIYCKRCGILLYMEYKG